MSTKSNVSTSSVMHWTLADAYRGPGHLIRRLQQIAVGIFMGEFKSIDITPVQYMALVAVRDRPGLEQQAIAELIAIDRSSAGRIFQFLEERNFIQRVTPTDNRRTKQVFVTPAGARLLNSCSKLIRRAEGRILNVLDAKEQKEFMQLLVKLVDINNTQSRAPLNVKPGRGKRNGAPAPAGALLAMAQPTRAKRRGL